MSNQAPQRSLLKPICYVLLLLAIDAAISLGLVSSMVSFLHGHGNGPFEVEYPKGSGFLLAGHPAGLVVNQGHTTNAAGGTALVLVGFGGVIALFLERRSRMKYGKSAWEFELWAFVSILSCLLTLGALIYTFVETRITSEQLIDPEIASQYPFPNRYPDDRWAPENWYGAMLALPISTADENEIIRNIRLMRGWRWNIIPLFLLGFTLAVLASLEVRRTKNSLARSDYPMKQMS
ncbi:hypothetical protein QBC35DRAFT_379153 [Podospora australis]|uniref:Uncharacterized protein n=1 Tax=Podospora australis TaxID=1536484 RepID=A0AAN7AL12_9PEZI|nr:hypothetical protein QBC35DRAFT_379153 [Podospora australis]